MFDRNGHSPPFLTVAVGSCSAGVWPSAIEIELTQCSMPRPLLVKSPDAILRLDPESPKGKQYGAVAGLIPREPRMCSSRR